MISQADVNCTLMRAGGQTTRILALVSIYARQIYTPHKLFLPTDSTENIRRMLPKVIVAQILVRRRKFEPSCHSSPDLGLAAAPAG